jgi:dTDP-glucose 4,6-dehydratase
MPNILVTGGAGFIGSNFVHYVLREAPDVFVVNLDALTYAANPDNLKGLSDPDRYLFIEGDIRDRERVERVLADHQISTIVHFAAESHVDRSVSGPEIFVQTNIVGTFCLLEAARRIWLGQKIVPISQVRFHHVSTDEVYGSLSPGDPAFTEASPYAPNSPYAASKASSDHLVRSYFHTYGLPISITNCSNNYGLFQFPEKLIPLTILHALSGQPLPIYGDGRQVRDWLYVGDHCEALWQVITRGRPGMTYLIGGQNQPTNIQVVEEICALLDELAPDSPYVPHSRLIQFVPDRPGHDRRYQINIEKIKRELGWRPKYELHEGLRMTVKWYLGNPEWISAIGHRSDYRAWLWENYHKRGGGT